MVEFSPSGKQIVPSVGPLDAKIVIVGESPASEEIKQGQPLVGPSGKMLNKALVHAGIDRSQCRIMNLVPIRAPGDKFANHSHDDLEWGRERFRRELASLNPNAVFIALGANPTEWLLGGKPPVAQRGDREREGFIGAWRGSVIRISDLSSGSMTAEDYLSRSGLNSPLRSGQIVVPTFHPAAVLRQFNWHPWFLSDIRTAAKVSRDGPPVRVYRQWYKNDVKALKRLAASGVDLIAVDSELDPWLISIATEDEVHVFVWSEDFREPLEALLTSPKILKVAHRWLHDYAFFRKCIEIEVQKPMFDSVGGAHILNTALQKELSPHISTRFTTWPYHKWLTNVDQWLYCGMDSVVCYDAYWPMLTELTQKGLTPVAIHDHRLFTPLLEMQATGFRVDEGQRVEVEKELKTQLESKGLELNTLVQPIIEKELKWFHKPHLFRVERKCECCGGGKTQAKHCFNCAAVTCKFTSDGEVVWKDSAQYHGFKTIKAFKGSFPECYTCKGTGKVIKALDFNPDSPDQLADVIYRGLHIRPRKFKGKETIKAAQLDPIRDKSPIIESVIQLSEQRAQYDTVKRLRAGTDGLLHCEFDPWGTSSGRIAGKEGLLEPGTNPMNLPKEARRFVVPRPGKVFLYPDMAQVEARAMAVISGDKNLRKALYDPVPSRNNTPDYHTWLLEAIRAYDGRITLSRDQSKRVSYAGFYGARPEQLAKELTAEAFRKGEGMNVDAKMAQVILDTLFRVCPEVPRWQNAVCEEVLRTKQLKSPTGRIFTWTGYVTGDSASELDYEVKKQVWSRLPQDMGAWVLGEGLIDLYYNSGEWNRLLTPLIHVHDALLIETPEDRVEDAKALALKYLTRYIWDMDWIAEIKNKRGVNWYEVS